MLEGMKGMRRRLRVRRRAAYLLLSALLLAPSGDRLHITPARDAASDYVFSLVQWHAANFFDKWVHLAWEATVGGEVRREERIEIVHDYLQTSLLREKEERQMEGRIARTGGERAAKVERISRDVLDELRDRQRALRPRAEEAVESELSAVLKDEGFGWRGPLLFPPVDIKFARMPTMIVTSRRDKIERLDRLLLQPDLEHIKRGELEDTLLGEYGLSAFVGDLAGLSTYPTLVTDTDSLRSIMRTAAHEWLHVYWFFRPFGQSFWSSSEMGTLNETAADIAGRELGDAAFARMGGDLEDNARRYQPQEERDIRFTEMMRETRGRTEELLAEGRVLEAEEYMKERWWRLRLGGYGIRKLNQAYFAFYGIYGESASSVSPIGDQMAEFRSYFRSVGEFVRVLSGVSSYGEFLKLLAVERATAFDTQVRPDESTAGGSGGMGE